MLTGSTNNHHGPWVVPFAALVVVVGALIRPVPAQAGPAPVLSHAQQLALARAFAPTLLFHPEEQYFPTNVMSSVDRDGAIGAWSSRVEQYRARDKAAKLRDAALAYRVFTRIEDGHAEVVLEYWCYYVYNSFTVRGGWFPYRVRDDHPHDLERLYFVLRPTGPWSDGSDDTWARDAFRIVRVVANAHDGSIAPNEYRAHSRETLSLPVSVLVERGSHAMAPDIDGDGRFTPGVDSPSALKAQWGIRDTGSTWRWYLHQFMDKRDASAQQLCGPASELPDERCPRYALYPVESLQRWFQDLQLTSADREEIVGRTSWLVRTFGDVRIENLMVPSDPANDRVLDRMLRRRSDSESGFVAGFTTVDHAPTLVVGRRTFWELPSGYAPDILAEAVALLPNGKGTLFETTVWGSYRVDAITNVLIGFGWFSESGSPSMAIGTEIRMGKLRVRPSWRLNDGGFDSRVTATF